MVFNSNNTHTSAEDFCPVCNKPRLVYYKFGGSIRCRTQLCDCETKARDARAAERKKEEEFRELQIRQSEALGANTYKKYTFENDKGFNKGVTDLCKRYVETFPEQKKNGRGFIFYGKVGSGKSYSAGCIVNELIKRKVSCFMDSIPHLIGKLTSAFPEEREEIIRVVRSVSLLVLDDLGAESGTPTQMNLLYLLIDERYKSGLPMIITTNLNLDELQNPDSMEKHRVFSRILERCEPVRINSVDVRKNIEAEASIKMREQLLGKNDETDD